MLRRTRDYIVAPTRYFEEQLLQRPDWWLAAAGPLVAGGLLGIQATLAAQALRDVQIELLRFLDAPLAALPPTGLMAAAVTLAYPALFGVALLALLAINVLYKDAARPGRLAELTGICFLTQIPFCLASIGLTMGLEPEPFRPPPGADPMEAVLAFGEAMADTPTMQATRAVSLVAVFWLAFQLTCAIRVAGRLSQTATLVVGLFLLLVFGGAQLVGLV